MFSNLQSRGERTMNSKAVMAVLLATVLGLTGCTKTIHGGGEVTLFQIALNGEPGQPGPAEVGISFTCNDKSNQISGVLNWVDNTNGVSFTARLPWTPVGDIFGESIATCADA